MRKTIILFTNGPNIGCANAHLCALSSAAPEESFVEAMFFTIYLCDLSFLPYLVPSQLYFDLVGTYLELNYTIAGHL